MARSTEEIFNSLVARKESLAALDVYLPEGPEASFQHVLQLMNSHSKVALWLLLLYVVAEGQHVLEKLWDYWREEVEGRIRRHKPGTRLWYKQKALEWQYGDVLMWLDGEYRYAVTDESARLVKQASVTEVGGVVRIKVAKDDGGGGLTALTAGELAGLNAYFVKVRYAGVKTVCVSYGPDVVRVKLTVRYDALADAGAVQAGVKAAVKGYLRGLPFDGKVVLSALVDSVQGVAGVRDVVCVGFWGTYGSQPWTDCLTTGYYETQAGYAVHDEGWFDGETVWEAEV